VQRLFSTFADGWPGGGLFTQRVLLGAALVYSCVGCLSAKPVCGTLVPQSIGALAGVLLVAGLWTPVAGVLAAIAEGWIAFSIPNSNAFPATLGVLGATLAMIGPGAWSLDAWLFGRKHIEPPEL
jgi:putative oxidoreductase